MNALVQQAVGSFVPITLQELEVRAYLQTRTDNKYVVTWHECASLLEGLIDDFSVLEIDRRRTFGYETVYFDTDSLTMYRAHMQGRRKRFKFRSRHYVDTGTHFFQMKMKGPRGETIKQQMACDGADAMAITADAWQFVRDCLTHQYGLEFDEKLVLSLRNDYRRMTLVARKGGERLTCDFDVSFEAPGGRSAHLLRDFVILETKAGCGRALADTMLRAMGIRPHACSKYCVGTALSRLDVKSNGLRRLLRRYFESDAKTEMEASPV